MSKKGKCYLAGPMRGIKDYNYPAFQRGAALLRQWGWEVFSPAENDSMLGFDPTTEVEPTQEFLRRALADDLWFICMDADAIFLLPGWENSKGTQAEYATAVALGLTVTKPEYWYNAEPSVDGRDLNRSLFA